MNTIYPFSNCIIYTNISDEITLSKLILSKKNKDSSKHL